MKGKSRKRSDSSRAHRAARPKHAWLRWVGVGVVLAGIFAVTAIYFDFFAGSSRSEFRDLVRRASVAAQEGDIAEMRRLHLNDALLSDADLRRFFADFAQLEEGEIASLRPDFSPDTYCWVRLPRSSVMLKFTRGEGVWWIQGDSASVEF
ncbi:MAG: hypothetical protein EAZ36_02450 [Verrucomicrobia bacterium]|nr:MAG: hypothetical protein EAZ36_02450 [Verrucomicrobiota bacterium]